MQIFSSIAGETYLSPNSFSKSNPFNGEALAQVFSCDLMGLVKAISSANKSFQEWKLLSVEERLSYVQKCAEFVNENQNTISQRESLDQGLPLWFTKRDNIQSTLEMIKSHVAEAKFQQEHGSALQFGPVGAIAIVGSWNLSLKNILSRVVPALIAGNTCVVKVSSLSPSTALTLGELITHCNFPAGVISVMVTDDLAVKSTLISHPGIKAVSFCGTIENSVEVMKLAQQGSLQNFKKIQIYSGSKNPAVALSDVDDHNFESIIQSFLVGQGQLAYNSSRLFVLEKHEAKWIEKIRDYFSNLKPAESIEDSSIWTPCLKLKSVEKFAEIKRQAHEDQAKLVETAFKLSPQLQSLFLPPIFTRDMSRCSTLQQDQIHSPFFILSAVKYPFDVAKYSNVSYYGYAAHLFGEKEKLEKISQNLDVGAVFFNRLSSQTSRLWSSQKQSGFGIQDDRAFGAFFSNSKFVVE